MKKIKQWALGVSVVAMLGLGWACTDEDAPDNLAPGFSSFSADHVMRTSAKLSASLTGSVNLVKEYGFQYSTSSEFPTDQTKTVKVGDGQPSGSFMADLSGLERNKTYYYRVYASTGATTVYSKHEVFNTPPSSAPDLAEAQVIEIGEDYAKVSFKLVDVGDENLIECGVGYTKANIAEATYTPVVASLMDSVYVAEIYDLEASTAYKFRPYAKNGPKADGSEGVREGYSDPVTATTTQQFAPKVITQTETSSGINTITVSGLIGEDSPVGSDGTIFDCGFVWSSENPKPRLELNDDSQSMPVPEEIDGNFVYTIEGLMSERTYYVCAYARNNVDGKMKVGYGNVITVSTTPLLAPIVGMKSIVPTASSLILQATITDCDTGALKEKGFLYARSGENLELKVAKENETYVNTLTGTNVFTDTIPGLTMSTSYFVRAYAVYEAAGAEPAIGYSEIQEIKTSDYQAPGIGLELNHSKVTRNSAELVGKFYSEGNGMITEKGFVLIESSVTNEPTLKHKGVKKIVSDDSFVTVVKDLQKETSYAVRSYAISKLETKVDTIYSGYSSFQTLGISAPAFNNVNLEEATYNSFKVTCGMTDIGDGKLLEKGFWYRANGNNFEEYRDSIIVESEAYDEFSTVISGNLEFNRNYYVCAYAKKDVDGVTVISTSGWSSIWIPGPSSTNFGEIKLDSTTYHSFVVTANINELGDGTFLEKGVFWKKNATDFENGVDSLIVESDAHDSFAAKVQGLDSDAWYYVGAYTKMNVNDVIVINRSGWNSTWVSNPSLPSFENFNVNNNDYKKLNVSAKINSSGDGEIVEKGFCWRAVSSGDWTEPSLELNDGTYVFEGVGDSIYTTIDNLNTGTEYYVRAYAKVKLANAAERVAYSWTSSATIASPDMPSLRSWVDIPWDNVTRNSFKVTAQINDMGNGTITNRGFVLSEYDKNSDPTIEACDKKWDDVDETFEKTITGLKHNTTYAVRAFLVAKWEEDTDTLYNSVSTVTTNSVTLPTFKRLSFSDTGLTSFNVETTITDNGEGTLKEKGFCWNRSTSDFTLDTENIASKAVTTDTLKHTLKDLEANTTYYVRAYAKVEIDSIEYVAYSNVENNTTSSYSYPSLNTPKSDSEKLTRNSAYLTGVVNSAGNGDITERGFVLSLASVTYEPTFENNVAKVVADADFAATVSGLNWNTEYVVRSYVISKWTQANKEEVTYSNGYSTFRTKDVVLPKFNNVEVDSITYSSFKVASGISSLGDGTLIEKGFVWRNSADDYWREPTANDCTGMLKVESDSNDSYSLKVDGLLPGQRYGVRAYAKVKADGKEAIGYSGTHWVNVSSLGANVNWTPAAVACDITVEFTQEAANVKGVHVYLTTDSSETDLGNYTKYTLSQDETTLVFSGTLDNLSENTTYYMKVYYEYAGNMVQYTDTSFSTKRTPQAGDNISPDKKEE